MQTGQILAEAYSEATAGFIQGVHNIYDNSSGLRKYDFGYANDNLRPGQDTDYFIFGGNVMTSDQFGNFIAGFQGEAYDNVWSLDRDDHVALHDVFAAGLIYHNTKGGSKAKDDPCDLTGIPYILSTHFPHKFTVA